MDRNELITHLSLSAKKKSLRGNTLWCLFESHGVPYIKAYDLFYNKERNQWEYKEYTENDEPPLTCPDSYLIAAPIVNNMWREQVKLYKGKKINWKCEIRNIFKTLQKGEKIRVKLKPREGYRIDVDELLIVSVTPGIEGRAKNGKRYLVPLRLVHNVEIIRSESSNDNE
jgi:hypothetical protein